MSRLILITGDIATGKTAFSKQLSERYNIEVYNKDTIKEILADEIGFSNREENLNLSHAAVNLMIHIFEQHAELYSSLVLEANFHRNEIERILEIAEAKGIEVFPIVIQADTDILYKRFRHRVEFENRHPAHQSAGLDTLEAFEEYVLSARRELNLDDCIVIDANDFEYQNDMSLLRKIDDFME